MEDDVPCFKGKLWKPEDVKMFSVTELDKIAKEHDAREFLLKLELGYYDLKHSWEYERPSGTSRDALLYNVMMASTRLMVIRAEMDEASRTS